MDQDKKTTKQVLEEALKDQKRTPLYNREALDELKKRIDGGEQQKEA